MVGELPVPPFRQPGEPRDPTADMSTLDGMDDRAEAGDFLRTRRARITPEQADIIGGGRRRVPGLRREEVAMLTGVSVEYYARMERGDLAGVSATVLDAVANALQLNGAEHDHLRDLARAVDSPSQQPDRYPAGGPELVVLQRFLDAVTGIPMWVRDRRLDFVAANALGRALYAPLLGDSVSQGNTARFTFLNPAAKSFFPDWEQNADSIVATLRTYVGQNPQDAQLAALVQELSSGSVAFRQRWSEHNVRHHHTGVKRINHPDVGELEFQYRALVFPENPEWFVFAYTVDADSATEQRMKRLDTGDAGVETGR